MIMKNCGQHSRKNKVHKSEMLCVSTNFLVMKFVWTMSKKDGGAFLLKLGGLSSSLDC